MHTIFFSVHENKLFEGRQQHAARAMSQDMQFPGADLLNQEILDRVIPFNAASAGEMRLVRSGPMYSRRVVQVGTPRVRPMLKMTRMRNISPDALAGLVRECSSLHDVMVACGYKPERVTGKQHQLRFKHDMKRAALAVLNERGIDCSHLARRKARVTPVHSRVLTTERLVGKPRKPITELKSKRRSAKVLARDLAASGRPYLCEGCRCRGMTFQNGRWFWMGKPLVLQVDHINGIDGTDDQDRLDNLRFLCANCHSQTSTFCRGRPK